MEDETMIRFMGNTERALADIADGVRDLRSDVRSITEEGCPLGRAREDRLKRVESRLERRMTRGDSLGSRWIWGGIIASAAAGAAAAVMRLLGIQPPPSGGGISP